MKFKTLNLDVEEHMHRILEAHALKNTKPRVIILNAIQQLNKSHFSAYDIIDELHKNKQRLSNSTTYRVLNDFEKSNIIKKCQINTKNGIYEINTNKPHVHLVCKICDNVQQIICDKLLSAQTDALKAYGYSTNDTESSIYGICEECSKAA